MINVRKRRLQILNLITAVSIILVLLLGLLISIKNFLKTDFNQYDNQVRLLVEKQRDEIESGNYQNGKYAYRVVDLSGKILFTSEGLVEKKAGTVINLQEELQVDKNFQRQNQNLWKESFALRSEGKVAGFVTFFIPKNEIYKNEATSNWYVIFLPMMISMTICVIILAVRSIYCNRCILKPINEISASARAIILGNYELEVVRTFGKEIGENEIGELTYAFESMRDELKEKQMREQALKKSQQELISCVSHDLKTPISTIKAYGEGLRDHIAENEAEEKEYIHTIIEKTDLLTGMINDLLEVSNAELKQLGIFKEEIYFKKFIEDVMKELKRYVEHSGILFSFTNNMKEDMIVNMDAKRITEVIYNIIDNSIKYIGDKEDGKIEITAQRKEKSIFLRISDNGIGIEQCDIPYVFDKFYRAEKSRSTSIPGSGLGLSICKYIVEEHNGEIYCRSKKSTGTEFGFTLKC